MIRNLIVLTVLVLLTAQVAQAGPVMIIDQPNQVLDNPVLEGETAVVEFAVDNRGDGVLTIESVTPG
ncbi:MAG: hypothetical protein V1816_21450 [Pseudomonadota bacterium]